MSQNTPPVRNPSGATTAPSTALNFDFTRGLKRTRGRETTSIRAPLPLPPPLRGLVSGRDGPFNGAPDQNSTTWPRTGTTTSDFGFRPRSASPNAKAGASSPCTTVIVRIGPVRDFT